ncbi:MAG TPA: DUF1622 domain-containing protein [Thermodesulfobacteriota bacterium]|nr:DUF1622 domain-containing protein [Thermodesulfobacteriota bacterium]
METFRGIFETLGLAIDGAGVIVIIAGVVIASVRYMSFRKEGTESYRRYRQDLGRAILLGLEFLVAGDIIRTVAVSPTLQNLYILGLIVLIRTFLSMALQVELEGRWPWQRRDEPIKTSMPVPGA